MILIIEGMDNCGKSTLIKQIRKYILKSPETLSMHCATPPDGCNSGWSQEHYSKILELSRRLSDTGWDIILDRSHLGEDVYGPIYRNEEADYVYDLEEAELHGADVKLIVLLDSPENALSREDGDSYSTKVKDVQRIHDRFLAVFDKTTISGKMLYHISDEGGFENLFTKAERFINAES